MAAFPRQVIVQVRSADNYLIKGAVISWKEDGKDRGGVDASDGHATLTLNTTDSIVEVSATVDGVTETRKLAAGQQDCAIQFNEIYVNPETWSSTLQKHLPALAGIGFVLLALVLGFSFPSPTGLQIHLILAVLSLGGGAFGTEISGMIKANLSIGKKFTIAATGAAAIFVILYFAVPAGSPGALKIGRLAAHTVTG